MSPFDLLADEIEGLGQAPARAAKAAAPRLLHAVKAQHAAGQAPDGSAWPPTKDARVALTHLTSQTTAKADGAAIVLTLDGLLPHQVGSERLPRRQVVPSAGEPLPEAWATAIDEVLRAELGEPR